MRPHQAILALLYDSPGPVPADELASAAGVSRERLAAALAELRQRGHEVVAEPGRGLRLVRPVRPDATLIERGLDTRRIGRHVICFAEVGSTNDVAWDSLRQPEADGLVVLAERQRAGRGRLGRDWLSPAGANVLMSVLLCEAGAGGHHALTVASGLAVAEGVEAACGVRCGLKWPNDVQLDGRKLAGVLVEARQPPGARERAFVIGVGVNANAAPPDDAVDVPAACLATTVGHPVERIDLTRAILRKLDAWTGELSEGRLEALHERWLARCEMLNTRVRVGFGGREHVGLVVDIDPTAGLVLRGDDGRNVHIPAAGATLLP